MLDSSFPEHIPATVYEYRTPDRSLPTKPCEGECLTSYGTAHLNFMDDTPPDLIPPSPPTSPPPFFYSPPSQRAGSPQEEGSFLLECLSNVDGK